MSRPTTWATLRNHIMAGRTGVSRPLYEKSLSARFVEPNNPDSDITINYRWRHMVHDTKALSRTKWGRQLIANNAVQKELNEHGETIGQLDKSSWWKSPVMTFRSDETAVLHVIKRDSWGYRRVMLLYSGVEDMRRYNGVLKIRQHGDPLKPAKRKNNCRKCNNNLSYTYTCWKDHGPFEEDIDTLREIYGYDHISCMLHDPNHNTHIVTTTCYNCKGTGESGITPARWDSFVWDKSEDVVIDLSTRKIKEVIPIAIHSN
jgi:hypothetical protein